MRSVMHVLGKRNALRALLDRSSNCFGRGRLDPLHNVRFREQNTRYARRFLVSSLRLSHDVNHLNEGPTSLFCLGNPPR